MIELLDKFFDKRCIKTFKKCTKRIKKLNKKIFKWLKTTDFSKLEVSQWHEE